MQASHPADRKSAMRGNFGRVPKLTGVFQKEPGVAVEVLEVAVTVHHVEGERRKNLCIDLCLPGQFADTSLLDDDGSARPGPAPQPVDGTLALFSFEHLDGSGGYRCRADAFPCEKRRMPCQVVQENDNFVFLITHGPRFRVLHDPSHQALERYKWSSNGYVEPTALATRSTTTRPLQE